MPLIETLPVRPDTAQWPAWGTVARLVVTDPAVLDQAAGILRDELSAVEQACSRFRPASEIRDVCRSGGRPVIVSALLAELVGAALTAARETDGAVDPTVGGALCALGYDRDFAELAGRTVGSGVRVFPAPDWRAVRLRGRELTVPHGMLIDLGATAKAVAADRAAARITDRLGTGVLVALGGDIATAGSGPDGGWQVLVQDRPGDPSCTIRIPAGSALATSSTAGRTWGRPGELLHHIVDPATGRPAPTVWRTVSVAAFSCLQANTLSTAAIVRGHGAPRLLAGVPSRLVTPSMRILRTGGWPA
ncbi:FAD:protein FMN transferase [Actinoplanes derwentensis]|uniref:FAD:protein FMN transferase n=1 Tax=Actinoplanes derwentensis TaxID=113562 RepID=A0A1H2CX63_9ACTN|nr:FAD:protein FMN transferase [Actinoplanes derwentensis]GID87874.1 FAD:protein FMN transferase [Actinoplanes derwentensis]SDT74879.1 thiamine biosynthesis lipoprotein [Actinoplanes derwentensis]